MFEQALQAVGYGILITDAHLEAPGPSILFVNPSMCRLTGYAADELIGRSPRVLQGPETDRATLYELKQALRDERNFTGEAINYRKDGSRYVVDWTIDPVVNDAGTVHAWISVQRDVSRRRATRRALEESERRLRVLVGELQHRTRNLMVVVRSIASKTAHASADLPDFRSRFGTRLDALSRVQGLLSRLEDHDRVRFDELVRTELAAIHGDDRVTLTGPADVRLRSSTVQTLAMGLHELATNAVKYGALGQPDGRLAITWSLEPAGEGGRPWLHIDWRETGVDMRASEATASRTGQGRELIEQALPYQLEARTSYALGPDGVHCTIAVPVSASTLSPDPQG